MIYQHPLAYLLALEGLALLRGWAGDVDRSYVEDRLAEVRRLLADETLGGLDGVEVARGTAARGYQQWADHYDDPGNGLFELDESVLLPLLAELPAGDALDAACGTGRLTRHLAARHRVVGVDSSPDMLRRAAARLPGVDLRLGELDRLPVADDAVDLVASTLALSHVGDLAAVMAEFARVLRPGGDLLVSDVHHELVLRGSVVHALGPDGEPGLVPTYRHTPGDFLRAALPAGFRVLACEEPRPARAEEGTVAPATEPGGWHDWPWSLMAMVPEASRIAWDVPSVVVWHFRLDR